MADTQADGSRFLLGLRLEQKFRPTEGVGAISLSIFHYPSIFSIILQYIPLFFSIFHYFRAEILSPFPIPQYINKPCRL